MVQKLKFKLLPHPLYSFELPFDYRISWTTQKGYMDADFQEEEVTANILLRKHQEPQQKTQPLFISLTY
jgi:hypothetical protein